MPSPTALRKRPVRKKKLSHTQLRLLHNIANDRDIMTGVAGQSAHGGFPQTLESVKRRELIELVKVLDKDDPEFHVSVRWKTIYALTVKGAEEHQAHCCHKGLSADDARIRLLETQIKGGEKNDERSFFGDSFE